ncbi:protein trichome birefringence-like 25 [Apium graveolens]|uniref:protein trichome birefringence-like 25 n=1 Tax=Apium graveolens TaxID=4045 RepID=UPI003D7B95DE
MHPMAFDSSNTTPNSLEKYENMFVKCVVGFLFLGVLYRFYFFTPFPPVLDSDTDFLRNSTVQGSETSHLPGVYSHARCNIFVGEWVPDSTAPFYTNKTCQSIEEHQNCMENGRPESGYVYWRWTPRDCALPRFDPVKFLRMMRNKSMAFIGDSISRNHVQSLLCILTQVEKPNSIYHDKEYRSRTWYFPLSGFTLSVVWSPFLLKSAIFENKEGVASDIPRLHFDKLDPAWVDRYKEFDYIEIGAGKWFFKTALFYKNDTIVGCHNCPQKNLTKFDFTYAYRKAIQSVLKFITSSEHKAYAFFRTSTPDHFENGEWNTGGYCNRTVPFKEGEVELIDLDLAMRKIELEEFAKAAASDKSSVLRLFDTTHLSLLRPDGHPGPYRRPHPFSGKDKSKKVQLDCLHWCLPGPIDTWNALMMHMLLHE